MISFCRHVLALLLVGLVALRSCEAFSAAVNHRPQSRRGVSLHGTPLLDGGDNSDDAAHPSATESRRSFLSSAALLGLAAAVSTAPSSAAAAAPDDQDLIEVYFGCGCFWHVQHELVQAEKSILGRSDDQLSSRAGYAGGKAGAVDGKVCYHNAANIADYGKLGHAEVVSLKIPPSEFPKFAVEYCKLFKDGLRPDQYGDRGPEYRNLVGLPGGAKSEYAKLLVKASQETGDQLDFAVGKGNDSDAPKVVFVMDTSAFPSYVAEEYHQFHDGFNLGENYPNSYNSLAGKFKKAGEDFGSCPNGMLGVGVAGL